MFIVASRQLYFASVWISPKSKTPHFVSAIALPVSHKKVFIYGFVVLSNGSI